MVTFYFVSSRSGSPHYADCDLYGTAHYGKNKPLRVPDNNNRRRIEKPLEKQKRKLFQRSPWTTVHSITLVGIIRRRKRTKKKKKGPKTLPRFRRRPEVAVRESQPYANSRGETKKRSQDTKENVREPQRIKRIISFIFLVVKNKKFDNQLYQF